MKSNPCKNCPKKGCGSYHDICKEYQESVRQNTEEKEAIRKEKWIYSIRTKERRPKQKENKKYQEV